MSKSYRELVALRVVFSKVAQKYRLVHYYRLVQPETRGGPLELQGYDMVRDNTIKEIEDSLRSAYEPAILSVWLQDETTDSSQLLQLQPGASPEELHLQGTWSIWADG